jgi:hypothetical protein
MINLPRGPEKTFAEFFAGIGLMRLGLERQGWKIAVEKDFGLLMDLSGNPQLN